MLGFSLLSPSLPVSVLRSLSASTGPRFRRLNAAVASLLDEYSLVSFTPLDISDEESIGDALLQVRSCEHLRHVYCCLGSQVAVQLPQAVDGDGSSVYCVKLLWCQTYM